MTNDLLNLHLTEAPGARPSFVDISAASLAARILEDHAGPARSRRIDLDVSTDSEDLVFASDTALLHLIVDNLLDNALKFTPAGGKVTAALRGEADSVTLRVADTGCGIPEEIQDRVFERFFQAGASRSGDAAVRGTGLGLAIVKHAADRLGGLVNLESRPGEGTTITVTLPLTPRGA
jgi:signal transduction histidine kinase